jgi:ABC-type glycerol-3-phosphate transport system substrate-binding protein
MIDNQDRWFRERLKGFAEEHHVDLKFVSYDRTAELRALLESERDATVKTIGLVKIQKPMLATLVEEGLVMPLAKIVGGRQLVLDLDDYVDTALGDVYFEGKKSGGVAEAYYIPRKLEANTLLYRRSKVAEAVQRWTRFRPQIERMFREHNGHGLPSDYELETDPNEWDWYDLAVVSFYWAKSEYGGKRMPRTAHRGRRYGGTMTEIATKIFQAGGDSRALLFEGVENLEAISDALEWEAFYRKNGLYNPAMWEQRWAGSHIWKAMAEDKVFLAFMHQLDAFFIHGNPVADLDGYLKEPDDMATAIMPRGVSLALDGNGKYVREGRSASLKTGWWWGIPQTAPNPELSYKLVRYITSKEFHLEESVRFGMLPIRKDVASELELLKSDPERKWMGDIFGTARRQLKTGIEELPSLRAWPAIESIWLDAWFDVVVQGNYSAQGARGSVDRAYIKKVLESYGRKIQEPVKN